MSAKQSNAIPAGASLQALRIHHLLHHPCIRRRHCTSRDSAWGNGISTIHHLTRSCGNTTFQQQATGTQAPQLPQIQIPSGALAENQVGHSFMGHDCSHEPWGITAKKSRKASKPSHRDVTLPVILWEHHYTRFRWS